ncbi:MAG: hypothetical protein ACRCX2_13555 [Paraclostridium sp.]
MLYIGKVIDIYKKEMPMMAIEHANRMNSWKYEKSNQWGGSNGTYARTTETIRTINVVIVVYDYPVKGNNKKVTVDVRDMVLNELGRDRVTDKLILNLLYLNRGKKIQIEDIGNGDFIPTLRLK